MDIVTTAFVYAIIIALVGTSIAALIEWLRYRKKQSC